MKKSIFNIANKYLRLKEYEKSVLLYNYLLQSQADCPTIMHKEYEFNKALAKKHIDNKQYQIITSTSLSETAISATKLLKENGFEEYTKAILKLSQEETTTLFLNQKDTQPPAEKTTTDKNIPIIFNQKLYAKKNKLNEKDAFIHYQDFFGEITDNETLLPVKDLKKKLWGGFSKETLALLKDTFKKGKYDDQSKAEAALILGKWYALQKSWPEAIAYLKSIKKYDAKLFRSRRVKLLLIDCMTHEGNFEQSSEMIEFVLSKNLDGDFLCAKSNLILSQNQSESTQQRLECINSLYNAKELSGMELADITRGFVFGNWKFYNPNNKTIKGPKVSVLMPVYNASEFIDVAINSMLSQTWENLEIIAVEDCGPDDSWEKLQLLAAKDSRLKIYRNTTNMGAYPTRNRALELATGDYITVHDSDDWSHPQMIEVQMKVMLSSSTIKATCSAMVRVHPDLRFILRPQRENLEYVHRSYPSLLMRREDVIKLGKWDGVSANADDEFIQRARLLWGAEAIIDVMPDTPLSFFLVHENSLTQQKGTSLNSLTFGIRKEYATQATFWRKNQANTSIDAISVNRKSIKDPFPIPQGLAPKHWPKNYEYDIVLISDLSLLGGTRRCNEGYIRAATEAGLRVGLFHWPRFDLKTTDIAEEYLKLCYQQNIDMLVPEDEIHCKAVIIHHPPILKHRIDATPKIKTENVYILVNQSPMQRWSRTPHYYDSASANALCMDLFGTPPIWIPISQRVANILNDLEGYKIHDEIWSPPFIGEMPNDISLPQGFGSDRQIIIGRHARNHWTKWPSRATELAQSYCANTQGFEVHLLGGAQTPLKMLEHTPDNWQVLEFDSIPVSDFISKLDFFLHFVHEDYIEEFGRNVMEAMAHGRVVILPHDFKDVFGEAAIYCDPHQVEDTCRKLWGNQELYAEQALKGRQFVYDNCSIYTAVEHLKHLLAEKTENSI